MRFPINESAEPRRAIPLRENELPKCKKSKTDTAEPRRVKLRTEREDPKDEASKTDKDEASLAKPRSESDEPMWATPAMEIDDPI